jgi:hypothetical protein
MIGVTGKIRLYCSDSVKCGIVGGTLGDNEPVSNIAGYTGIGVLTIISPREDPSDDPGELVWTEQLYSQTNPNYQRPTDPSKLGDRYAHHRKFTLAPVEDLQDCNALLSALRNLATPSATTTGTEKKSPPLQKKYLIVVNPRSGPKRNAAKLCEQIVQPIQRPHCCDVCVTPIASRRERMLP